MKLFLKVPKDSRKDPLEGGTYRVMLTPQAIATTFQLRNMSRLSDVHLFLLILWSHKVSNNINEPQTKY
jgi:hypothetical protein